jgi:hypothetical protein
MKKTLLLIGAFAVSLTSSGQVLQQETFDNLTLGNVGTAFDGSTAGQASLLTFASNGAASSTTTTTTNAGNSNFIIASAAGAANQTVDITGPNGNEGGRFLWQAGLDTSWTARTAGNDVIDIEYTFNTGPATTSRTRVGMTLYDSAFNPIVGYFYSTDTGILTGQARLNNGGNIANFNINFATGGLSLTVDTNYSLGMSYNVVTGEVLWKLDPAAGNISVNSAVYLSGLVPTELNFVVTAAPFSATATPPTTPNALAATRSFFDFKAEAVVTSDLLTTSEELLNDVSVKVYPNPTTDILNITSDTQQFTAVEIVDLNGRLIKSLEVDTNNVTANVQELKPGLYILNISNKEGTVSRKFIKE